MAARCQPLHRPVRDGDPPQLIGAVDRRDGEDGIPWRRHDPRLLAGHEIAVHVGGEHPVVASGQVLAAGSRRHRSHPPGTARCRHAFRHGRRDGGRTRRSSRRRRSTSAPRRVPRPPLIRVSRPDSTSTTQIDGRSRKSASRPRLATNAICRPSGDQAGDASLVEPPVSRRASPVATSTTHRWSSRSSMKPRPLNE